MAARKVSLVENLAAAAIMGFLSLLLVTAILLTESAASSRERVLIADLAGRSVTAKPSAIDDPACSRVFPLPGKNGDEFGAVIYMRSRSGTGRAAALFAGSGQLEAIRLVDGDSARLDFDQGDWFSSFLGKGADDAYPRQAASARDPAAVSGASESFAETAGILERMSLLIRTLGKERG